MRVLVFGDNIAHGFWDEAGGWPQRIRAQYDAVAVQALDTSFPDLYNLSISGETARGVIKRLPYEVTSRQDHQDVTIVIAIGMNDTMIYKGVEATPAELFRGELSQILETARSFTDRIIFVGITPVDDDLCDPWQYSSTGKCFNNERIQAFNTVIASFCGEEKVSYVDVFAIFQKKMARADLLADGLHPNTDGHALLARLIEPELDKILR